VPQIFDNIAWSSELVWEQTTERLRSLGHDFRELPAWYDVDDEGDLERLKNELSEERSSQSSDYYGYTMLRELTAEIVSS
jgi:glycosyltransferase A (GT-A) superfamily protein (DUF2064 family)